MPFSSCSPRSANRSPDPPTRSRTVRRRRALRPERRTRRRGRRCAPRGPRDRHRAARTRRYGYRPRTGTCAARGRRRRWRARTQTACVGLVERRDEPSPVVFTSRPPYRTSSARTIESCVSRSALQARSPSAAARSVEATMSLNSTVASTRSSRAAPPRHELLDLVDELVDVEAPHRIVAARQLDVLRIRECGPRGSARARPG